MQESEFYALAATWFDQAEAALEPADSAGLLEMERENESFTLSLPSGKILLVSRHTPMKQLWYASPVLGGLHFSYDGKHWALPDGRILDDVLKQELKTLAGVEATW